jgi:hypothetical protein
MNAFDEHARNLKDYENEFLAEDGTPSATLTFPTFIQNPPLTVTVTHTKIDHDIQLENPLGGFTNVTMVERCEFRSSQIPQKLWEQIKKGLKCTLSMQAPAGPVVLNFQLWVGGLVEGARVFRFALVSANFKG